MDGHMQWRRFNGQTGTYSGPLVDLGQAIPRRVRSWGPGAALHHFAYGYASGFPLRDVIPFALRYLLPPSRKVPTVEVHYADS